MLSEFVNVPIRKDDLVRVIGKGTGYERIRLQMFWRNDWNTSIRQFIA